MCQDLNSNKITLTARVFVRAVGTVFFTVTEESPFDTGGVTAGQIAVLAERFLGV